MSVPSWDDKNLACELTACDVCGKRRYMRWSTCSKCSVWMLTVIEELTAVRRGEK